MRKSRLAAVGVLAAVLAICVGIAVYRAAQPPEEPPPEESPAVYRIIGAWEGRVAVFLPQHSEPEQVYDTPLAVLPVEEQRRLEAGVAVENAVVLRERLEDYLG